MYDERVLIVHDAVKLSPFADILPGHIASVVSAAT
jgi:hypothetical protein